MSPKAVFIHIFRVLLLILALTIGSMIGGTISGLANINATEQSPETAGNALLALLGVYLITALLLSWVLVRARWRGWRLVLAVGVIYFGITSFMSQIETLYFSDAMKMDAAMVSKIIISSLITTLVFTPIAVLLFKKMKGKSQFITFYLAGWQWKLPLLAFIYVILYFTFGYYIAWQSAAVRIYYTGSADLFTFPDHILHTFRTDSSLVIFQFFRGFLWSGFVLLIIQLCVGKKWELMLLSGLLLGLLFTAQLFLPNPFMPNEIRMIHFVETATSTFIFGIIAAKLLLPPPKTASPILPKNEIKIFQN